MKALFIGGTGTISSAITALCAQRGMELTLLNRGTHDDEVPSGVRVIHVDVNDEAAVQAALGDERFDAVADFIAFVPQQVERDLRLFAERTAQYLYISSASAYQKPMSDPHITESTPLSNPFWGYSRNKIACEELLMHAHRETGFPATIIRPSHTYSERSVPIALHGRMGSYQVLQRMREGRKVIVPGDGLTLWTLTHASDFAKAFVGLMGNPRAIGNTYHITGDEQLTWNQIYEIVGAALGVKPQLVHIASETLAPLGDDWLGALIGDKSNNACFDNAKVKRAVPDYVATKRFDQGVRECIAFIDAHPALQQLDPAFDRWCDAVIERYEHMAAALPKLEG